MAMSCKDGKPGLDNGKYVRYTPEQVEALERLYHDCPKPSSIRRQQLIRECPILSNIEPKQIKVWFQNRRCTCLLGSFGSRILSSVLLLFGVLFNALCLLWISGVERSREKRPRGCKL